MPKPTHAFSKSRFSPSVFSSRKLLLFALLFGLIGGYILLRTFASPNPNLLGDLNADNIVNISDLSILLTNYGTTNTNADINTNGTVNILDLSILLSHYGQTYTPPTTVNLTANPTSITSGQSSSLSWTSTNATSCTASGAWSGSKTTSGSTSTGALSQTSTYTLTCIGPGGTSSPVSATVTVGGGGNSVFTADYETGNYKPWVQVSCSNYGYALGVNGAISSFGPYYTDTAGTTHNGDNVPAGQGSYFGEFSIPADSTNKQRCQNALSGRPTTFNAGEYFTLMVYVPVGWSPGTSAWGPLIAEPNYQQSLTVNSGKAFALTLKADHVTLNMSVGKMNSTSSVFPESSDADYPAVCKGTLLPCQLYAIPPGKLVQGAWNEIIVYDYFTTSNTGKVQAWYRTKGQTNWTQSVNLSGIPTLLYDATHDGSGLSIDAIGAYRGPGASIPMTVYLDAFTRSTSFSAAAAALP